MRIALIVGLTLCLIGCGRAQSAVAGMRLTSTAIGADGRIDRRQSAYGENLSPPLSWTNVPGAETYAIILEDSDAPGPRPFVHWLIWNIPGGAAALAGGMPTIVTPQSPVGVAQGVNDAGGTGYFGPKPPSGVHHYHFKIFALDERLPLSAGADRGALGRSMNGHMLGMGKLTGTYAAPGGR